MLLQEPLGLEDKSKASSAKQNICDAQFSHKNSKN